MRRWLIGRLPAAGIPVEERPVAPEDLLMAEEVFLSNAIRGIRWVGSFAGITYANKVFQTLQKLVDEDLG